MKNSCFTPASVKNSFVILWLNIKAGKFEFKDILSFLQSFWRWQLYKLNLLPKHIKEQIDYRMVKTNPECLKGHCVACGCCVPGLQFANKPCEGGCYPPMMRKSFWEWYKDKFKFKGEMNNPVITQDSWEETFKELGRVKKGEARALEFVYTGEYPLIRAVPTCGSCTSAHIKGNKVKATFIPNTIGNQEKSIRVELKTPTGILTDVLKFRAEVYG